jgi:hypothetical protein
MSNIVAVTWKISSCRLCGIVPSNVGSNLLWQKSSGIVWHSVVITIYRNSSMCLLGEDVCMNVVKRSKCG